MQNFEKKVERLSSSSTNIVRTVVRTNIVRTVVRTNIVRTVVRAYAVDILGMLVCIIDVYIKQDVEAG